MSLHSFYIDGLYFKIYDYTVCFKIMNIVIVIDLIDNLTNGSVMTARRFADGLKSRGHSVKIVGIGADGENDVQVKERYVPLLTEVSAHNQIRFGKYDKKTILKAYEGADIVHFIFPFKLEQKCKKLADEIGLPSTAAFHVQPEDISYNMHMSWFKPLNSFIYSMYRRKFYKRFNRIHCPSKFIANQLDAHGYKSELYVISNGYDKRFCPPEKRDEHEKFEIVMVGRLAPEKKQKILISAIALSKYKDKIHLSLFGHGPTYKKLSKQARKLGVDVTFDFLPPDKLALRLQQSDLYVHASTVEIEAIACLEAIACGLVPIISSSELSATPQFALDERSLFENDNCRQLAKKIDYWYENDEERLRMGAMYAASAKNYNIDNSLQLAERMFRDEINDMRERKSALSDKRANGKAEKADA